MRHRYTGTRSEHGFTLVELLVVILIIGILAAIAIPMFLNQRKAAVDASVKSDVVNAAKQVETWIIQQGVSTPTAITETGAIQDIVIGDGTYLEIYGNSFHYKVFGVNLGGDRAATDGIRYDSQKAGLTDDMELPSGPIGSVEFGKSPWDGS